MPARAGRVLDQVTRHLVRAAREIGRWVKGIWRRLTNEPGYAEAVAALVVAAAADLTALTQNKSDALHRRTRTARLWCARRKSIIAWSAAGVEATLPCSP